MSRHHVLLTAVFVAALPARAQLVSIDQAELAGEFGSAGLLDRSAAYSMLRYEDEPLTILDTNTRNKEVLLVERRLVLRTGGVFRISPELRLGFEVVSSPMQRGTSLATLPVASAGLGDLRASLAFELLHTPTWRLDLLGAASFPTFGTPYLGFSSGTVGGGLGATLTTRGLRVEARVLAGTTPSDPMLGKLGLTTAGWGLFARGGVAWTAGSVQPFVDVSAALAHAQPAGATVIARGGVGIPVGRWFEARASLGRGLVAGPGAPAWTGEVGLVVRRPQPSSAAPHENRSSLSEMLPAHDRAGPLVVSSPRLHERLISKTLLVSGTADPRETLLVSLDGRVVARISTDERGAFRWAPFWPVELGGHRLSVARPSGDGVEPVPFEVSDRDGRIASLLAFVRRETRLQAEPTPDGVLVDVNLLFAFDSAEIRRSERWKLEELARVVSAHPFVRLSIETHTDAVGSSTYNLELSKRRAAQALTFLVDDRRLPVGLVDGKALGESSPAARNDTAVGRAKNRRLGKCLLRVP